MPSTGSPLNSADEAIAFLETLRSIFLYTDTSYARSDRGQIRCDVNVSLMKEDALELGTRVEMKNINSFSSVREAIMEAEEATKDYDERLFNLAIGYDGRLEIVDAIKKIYKQVEAGEISIDDIDEEMVSKNLYTAGLEDPSLIIRTSGEERLSGFLLWQSSYSELYFCDSLWPELRKVDYLRAIRDYQERDRRFGV